MSCWYLRQMNSSPPYTLDDFLTWERILGEYVDAIKNFGKCHGSHSEDRKVKYNMAMRFQHFSMVIVMSESFPFPQMVAQTPDINLWICSANRHTHTHTKSFFYIDQYEIQKKRRWEDNLILYDNTVIKRRLIAN